MLWMKSTENRSLGWSTRASSGARNVITNHMASVDDSKHKVIYSELDKKISKMVNACFESLPKMERTALMKHFEFRTDWPYSNVSYEICLNLALSTFQRLVEKRCC